MCGITGWIDFTRDLTQEREILLRMNETLQSRGPDGEGFWFSKHAALGHRRLIVIDPEGGSQPMVKKVDGYEFVINYNGEIYNMEELRLKLRSLGHTLETRSDVELILTAYLEWGEDCPRHLNGIFAFVIWDGKKQACFAARDRLGVKPFFYTKTKDNAFLFGSELKAILAHPEVEPVLDDQGLAEILVMGPARTPGCGVFKDIHELRPGQVLRYDRNGLKTWTYWELTSREHEDDLETTAEKVRELFRDAVKRQLVSDIPVGTMLSGGLDSSAIAVCMAQVYKEENRGPLHTFSVDYIDNEKYFHVNEFQPNADPPWVKMMSEEIGSEHHTILLDNHELFRSIIQAMEARDLPGMADVDASMLLFAREIKKEMSVVLSGESADEVFGGYPWFHREEMVNADTFPWARLVEKRLPFISPEIKERVNLPEYVEARYQEALAEVPRFSEDHTREARMREMFYLNLTRWMPTLLDRNDRMSMAFGLEVRVPFCDHHLVEYVWNIPWSMKKHGNREKGLLRHAMKEVLPKPIVERKKSPYPKTHHPDYLRLMKKQIREILDDPSAPLFQLLDPKEVESFMNQDLTQLHLPWFGQLMNVPALLAYWWQINEWMKRYKVVIQ